MVTHTNSHEITNIGFCIVVLFFQGKRNRSLQKCSSGAHRTGIGREIFCTDIMATCLYTFYLQLQVHANYKANDDC